MATTYTRLPNTIGKPTEGELSVAEQEEGGLFDTGDGTTGVGAPGTEGPKGDKGDTGLEGPKGDTGAQGPEGQMGNSIVGPTGGQGSKGDTGATGAQGIKGETGSQGIQGDTGATGTGIKGDTGATGPRGAEGEAGTNGDNGAKGDTGPRGLKGDAGAASTVAGPTGATGSQGPTGATGAEGVKGDTGLKGDRGSIGDTGPQGLKGDKGEEGTASTVAGPTGSTGPTGAEGDVGPQGAQGPQGIKGAVGDTGAKGVQGSSVTGPKGDTGATGATGSEGDAGPQGDRGAIGLTGGIGLQGAQGVQGIKGDMGNIGNTGPKGDDAGSLSNAQIKIRYEANQNTNAFTNADLALLNSISENSDSLAFVDGVLSDYSANAGYSEGQFVVDNNKVFVRTAVDVESLWDETLLYPANSIVRHKGRVWTNANPSAPGIAHEPGASTNTIWVQVASSASDTPSGNSSRWTDVKANYSFSVNSQGIAFSGQAFSRGDIVEFQGDYYYYNSNATNVNTVTTPIPGTDSSVWVPLSTPITKVQVEGTDLTITNDTVNVTRGDLGITPITTSGGAGDYVTLSAISGSSTGLISASILPAIRISAVLVFDTIAKRNESTEEWVQGDIAVIITNDDSGQGSYVFTSVDDEGPSDNSDWTFLETPTNFASIAQGILADSAVQPAALTTALASYYTQTAANSTFATTAQGSKADSAVQPSGLTTALASYYTQAVANSTFATTAQGSKADSALQQSNISVNGDTLVIGTTEFSTDPNEHTWADYAVSSTFVSKATADGTLVITLLFKTGTTVYREVKKTPSYTDIIYSDEALTAVLATRGA